MSTSSAHRIVHTSRGSTGRSSTTSTYCPCPCLHHPFIRMRAQGVLAARITFAIETPHIRAIVTWTCAPTILKTTDSGYDGWAESFGEGGSDDGLWGGKWGTVNDREGWKERLGMARRCLWSWSMFHDPL
jgi:hypothetical protein